MQNAFANAAASPSQPESSSAVGTDKSGSDVLITSDMTKVPPDVARLLDPATPLPVGVIFFEKRYDASHMLRTLSMAAGCGLAALIIIPIGIGEFFKRGPITVASRVDYWPLLIGLVCALATWMMLVSLRTSLGLRRQQLLGQCTRRGMFLTPDALIQASENDTTVIPPAHFRGLDGQSVKYQHNDVTKSYRLPHALVNGTPEQLHAAIADWAAGHANV